MSILKFRRYGFSLLLTIATLFVHGQERHSPKSIKFKGDYIHSFTGLIFPEQFENYSRSSIYSFTKTDDGIEVTYESPQKTSIAIKVYPAGKGIEGRLRDEYMQTLQAISNEVNKTVGFEQGPVRKVGAKYICNGFKAVSHLRDNEPINQLVLYECGAWFLRVKISSRDLDTSHIEQLEQKVLEKYDPTKLTELKPFNSKSDFIVAPGLGKDRTRDKYILKSGFKKLEWAIKNVPENERASGFPDLYLNMHIEAFKELAECKDENFAPDNKIAKYISDINKVIKANYLPEFLMKQYNMVMITPDNMKFDFDGFAQWQEEYKI